MARRRIERVLAAVAAQPAGSLAHRLCSAAALRLDASGVGVSLSSGEDLVATLCATGDGVAAASLQVELGEGPAYDAHRLGWPVLVTDLEIGDVWPAFGPAAVALGMHATFAFPMRRGSVRLGAFTCYRRIAGALSGDEHADALVFARLALDRCLALQSNHPQPDDLHQLFVDGAASTAEVHQATGMVSVQLGISATAALAVLRAHAYAEDRLLRAVAGDVVAGRLRLAEA